VHAEVLVANWYWPDGQLVQTDNPDDAANLPDKQAAHRLALEPVVAKYVPARHGTQAAVPVAVWYCPAEQFKQAFELDPVEAKKVPAAQLKQNVAPVAVWYCPATQSMHEEEPLLAMNFPDAQLEQAFVDDPVDPNELPALQAAQADEPETAWYWPVGQLKHAFDPDPVDAR
jgi:hypothetical protein